MSVELIIIVALATLNVFQMFFWSLQCQRLVNKLMSRNYAEYNAIVNPPQVVASGPSYREYEDEVEEKAILNELNGIFKT